MALYLGNKETDEFHITTRANTPGCNQRQIKPENRVYFDPDTREEAVRRGYSPCGHCKP